MDIMQNANPSALGTEDLFRLAFENAPDGIAISENGRLISVNCRFLDIFGYSSIEEALNLDECGWIYPNQRHEIFDLAEKDKSGERVISNFIMAGMKRNGSPIAIEVSVARMDRNGSEIAIYQIRDNSNRIRIENQLKENLRESETRLEALMEASPLAYFWADLDGNVLYINRRFQEYFGYSIDEFLTMEDWRNLAYPDEKYRDLISPADVRIPDPDKNRPKESWIRCKDGSSRYVSRGKTIAGNRIMITYMDVTDVEQAKMELEASQAQLAEALHLAKAAAWSFDPEKLEYTFNDAFYALYGTNAEEQGGYKISIKDYPLRFIHPEDQPVYYKQIEENKNKTDAPDFMQLEERALRQDGKDMYVSCRMKVFKDAHGRSSRLLGVTQDVTVHKRIQSELAQRAEELACSNAELEQFVYVASHDLQEPLRMVASYTELLARRYKGKLGSDADEFIAFAVDGANRMKRLIDDLLSYSRVGTRGKPPQPTNSESAFQQAISNLSFAIEEKNAVVSADELPLVMADESQLIQLFQNLIANAIKFQDSKTPQVHVSAELNGREWVFSVKDNGIGIEPEYFSRIFLIFQRLHKKTEYPGTGIGLAVCKRIVERHGGRIWVESAFGAGSTFYFTFPIKGGK
jgi:PAS domain S-box-containing protein